ncbi:MAG: Na/Pi symporter, partial [Myxococcales bacterium]|nr:Na/Pi symporter [Myxococcales bacterium]
VGFGGAEFESPLELIVKPAAGLIVSTGESIFAGADGEVTSANKVILGVILAVLALGFLMFALTAIVKIMRGALAEKMEWLVDKVLFKCAARALLVGIVLTVAVQSSSVTTSLAIPMIGAGIVTIRQVYPYMLGANIGTTVTAVLAAFVTENPELAVTIAFCHLLFNVFATAVFLPLGRIPIGLATLFGRMCAKHRWAGIVYIVVFFFALPSLIVVFT